MHVFIIGGTGFIGYHVILKLLQKGHTVATLSLPDISIGSWFPSKVQLNYGNIFKMDIEEIIPLFKDAEVVIYAIGPDDRVTPSRPAFRFFNEYLVNQTEKVAKAAKRALVKKFIVLNSYFAYFARQWPHKQLSKHHPYIMCRINQANKAIAVGGAGMDVIILELPYIFGSMPERPPLWKDLLIDRLNRQKVVFFPRGGSNMISVDNVAEAVIGAVERGEHAKKYPIGDENLTWHQMLTIILDELGRNKKIHVLPKWIAIILGWLIKLRNRLRGKEMGLDPVYLFRSIQYDYFYFDPTSTRETLHYGKNNLEKAIRETVQASLKH